MASIASLAFGALEQTAHAQMTSHYTYSQYHTRIGIPTSSSTASTSNIRNTTSYAYSHNVVPTMPSSTYQNFHQSSSNVYSHNGTRVIPSFTYQNSSQSSGYVYQQRYNSTMTSQGSQYGKTFGSYSSYYNQLPRQNQVSNNGLSIQFSSYPINPVIGVPTYFKINFNKLDVDYTVSITQQGNPIYSTLSHTALGVANINFQFQTAGTYQVTIQANGMQQYPIQPVISTFSITVTSNQSAPSVSITPNSASYVPGQALTLSAMVTDTSNSPTMPTGPVTWNDGNIGGIFSPSTCYLSSGTCVVTYTAPSNAPNSITITASYGGDTSHTVNSGSTTLTINSASITSSSSVTVSPNPATYVAGTAVTFTATVTDPADSQSIPTGTMIWSDGTAGGSFNSSTCDLSSGTCTVTYTPSSYDTPNSISITTSYSGDTSHAANSGATTLTMNLSSSTTSSVTVSPNPATYVAGTAVTFTATVTDPADSQSIPTGTMIWSDGNFGGTFNSSTCDLSSGTCTVTYTPSANPPSAITLTASYGGDVTHQANTGSAQLSANTLSTSTSTTSANGLDTTAATIIPNHQTFSAGAKVTFAVTVADTTNPSSSMIGLVAWTDNGAGGSFSPDTCIVSSNTCSLQYTPPLNPSNSVTITAFYAGDSTHSGSTATSTLLVNGLPSSLSTTASTLATSPGMATPQEIQAISQAKANQTIAAEVNVGTNQSTTTSIDNNVSVQTTNTTPNSLNVNVTAPSHTGPKVISFNLNATTINVANLKDLGVMYDGQLIQPAASMDAILHAKSTDNPSFAIVVTQSGVQVLVLVPHFSTHSITIMNMSKIMSSTVPEFGPIVGVVITISIIGGIVISRRFVKV